MFSASSAGRLPVFLAVLLALGATASLAAPGAIGRPGKAAEVSRTVEVTMSDTMRFSPDRIAVKRGETVRLVVRNAGAVRHELMLGRAADLKAHAEVMKRHPHMEHDDAHAVSVPPGETREMVWRFTRGGTIDFACLVPGHYEAGMKGRVDVR
jgi:uncharacterized cupredoxin-like copper-binding protein